MSDFFSVVFPRCHFRPTSTLHDVCIAFRQRTTYHH